MAKPIKLVTEISNLEEIKDFLEYMNRPRTKKEKAIMEEAREIYRNTEIMGRKKTR